MALLSRIFQGRKSSGHITGKTDQQKQPATPLFTRDDIRLVVFRDHDIKGRCLIFDTKAIRRLSEAPEERKSCLTGKFRCSQKRLGKGSPQPAEGEGSSRCSMKFTPLRQLSDTNMLGEMLFGSIAIPYKCSTFKVHRIRCPSQLMVTKMFIPVKCNKESSGECNGVYREHESFDNYSIQSSCNEPSIPKQINGLEKAGSSIAHSVPVDVPTPPNKHATDPAENEDSGISASATSTNSSNFTNPYPSPSSSASLNSNSFNSLQRRWLRNQATSLEHTIIKRHSDESDSLPVSSNKRPPKFGIGIVFSLPEEDSETERQFQNFFFSHITLIESHVHKLKIAIEKALLSRPDRNGFNHLLLEATDVFRSAVYDLYTAPRLTEPVWLNMMCYTTHRVALCQKFLKEFMTVLEKYDTKNTKFFVSTLVTAVLTHHLAWVPTVTPAGVSPSISYLDKHSAKWLSALAKSHPYNPLWAQLGDLYGAIGFPMRLSRTIVTGKKSELVKKILYVLSYFIRCSEVHEHLESKSCPETPDDDDLLTNINPLLHLDDSISKNPSNVSTWHCPDTVVAADLILTPQSESSIFCDPTDLDKEITYVISTADNKEHNYRVMSVSEREMPSALVTSASPSSSQATLVDSCHSQKSEVAVHESETESNGMSSRETDSDPVEFSEHCNCKGPSLPVRPIPKPLMLFRVGDHISNDNVINNCDNLKCLSEDVTDTTSKHLIKYISCDETDCVTAELSNSNVDECNNMSTHDLIVSECTVLDSVESVKCVTNHELINSDTILPSVTKAIESNDNPKPLKPRVYKADDTTGESVVDEHLTCSLSPNKIREDERIIRVRAVGKESILSRASQEFFSDTSCNLLTSKNVSTVDSIDGTHDGFVKRRRARLYPDLAGDFRTEFGVTQEEDYGETTCTSDAKEVNLPNVTDNRDISGSPAILSGDTLSSDKEVATSHVTSPTIAECDTDETEAVSSDLTGTEENRPKTSLSSATKGRILLQRGNSMFDEYMNDETIDLPVTQDNCDNISTVTVDKCDKLLDYKTFCDEYDTVSYPDIDPAQTAASIPQERFYAKGDPLSMFDEYFNEQEPVDLPDCVSKDAVMSVLTLMKEVHEQEHKDQDTTCDCHHDGPQSPHPSKPHPSENLSRSADSSTTGGRHDSFSKLHRDVLTRQHSTTSNPARCRSVTPTELGRRRHASTTSSVESWDPMANLTEVPLPSLESPVESDTVLEFDRNFGRSLMAGFSDRYLSDFVLHGTSDENYMGKLHNDLTMSVQNSVLDEPIAESACIIADTDKWSVRQVACQYSSATRMNFTDITASQIVCDIIESVHNLWKLKMSPEFCLMHLEDRLQEVFFKSKVLSEYISVHRKFKMNELSAMLGCDPSDLPLLLAVAGTHTPHLALGLVS